jgi:hypothetical protein
MRRVISFFALTGYLVGHLAAVPHAHKGPDSAGHSRSHCHMTGQRHGHAHPHSHHQHPGNGSAADQRVADSEQPVPSDHGDDAIYLAASALVKRQQAPKSLATFVLAVLPAVPQSLILRASANSQRRPFEAAEHPPDGRHLFLELGCLLI